MRVVINASGPHEALTELAAFFDGHAKTIKAQSENPKRSQRDRAYLTGSAHAYELAASVCRDAIVEPKP